MKYFSLMLGMMLLALPLAAQGVPETPDPTPDKESFVIQPASVETGVDGQALRFVANDDSAFSTSSSKPPQVTFSAGVKLVPGSFQILNQNEAQCSVDVEDTALGTIEVSIELYSVNGTTVLRTLRGTLGIIGETPVGGSQAKVGAESVRLVVANSRDPQLAGNLFISGEVAGTVTITAPTGTTFAEEPVATSTTADINTPALQTANTVFTFGIGNSSLENVTVRITNIQYNTALFGLAGGVEGDLSVEIGGGALSNQTALVVNAFTAKTTLEGSNDIPDESNPPASETNPSTNEDGNGDTNNPAASSGNVNTGSRNSRGLEGNRERNNNRNNGDNTRNGASRRPVVPARGPDAVKRADVGRVNAPPQRNFRGGASPAPNPAGGGGAIPVTGGGSSTEMGGDGHISNEAADEVEDGEGKPKEVTKPKKLQLTPGLHFCDKEFNPVTAVVLDKLVSDEAGGRVWIVLKLAKDKNSDSVDTVKVKLTVDGTPRELILTETGKNTAEFRCSEEGILIVTSEDPDSNRDESEKQSPPKPRVR